MVIVKKVCLQNYCGYKECEFDFSEGDGVKSLAMFFGPNGIGKSTCLEAIRMASNPQLFRGRERESDLIMRKSIYDLDYKASVDNVKIEEKNRKNDMKVEVVFLTDDGEKSVILDNKGLLLNELPENKTLSLTGGYAYFCDADHPSNTQRFQLASEQADAFLDFAREVYGYECYLDSVITQKGHDFYTDFVIQKGEVNVHFKRMSAGERKIATLVSDLLQPINTDGRDIVLIDNVEMHVYYKRHAKMINKICSSFESKQLLCTTHSQIVINHVPEQYHYDLEVYRPDYALLETEFASNEK